MRWILPLLAALVALPALAQAPSPGDLVINEIMYDPPAPQPSGNEWIEVLNVSGGPRDVGGLTVSDGGTPSAPVPAGTTVPDGGYLVLVDNGAAFAAAYPGVPFVELAGFPALNNTGDRPALLLDGTEIDAVPYQPSWGGSDASLERRDPTGPSTVASNFGTTTDPDGGTPGEQNTLFAQDTQPPALVSAESLDAQTVVVVFDEPLDPATAETESNYQIDNGIGTPTSATLSDDGTQVTLALATPLTSPTTYTVTVTGVQDVAGNDIGTDQATFFFGQGDAAEPRDLVINEFLYDEPTTNNPGEFVELLNRTSKSFDLRDFTLNDSTGDDEPITNTAVFVEPGGYAVIVEDGALFQAVFPGVPFVEQPAWSALNNTGDAIVLKYQGTVIDSLSYTPSWGGADASLERKDPDGPSVRANFATTTDPRGGTPGEQNSQFAPDNVGPMLVGAVASLDGRTVTIDVDEPLDPASVTPGAFTVTGGPTVTTAVYDADEQTVTLTLSAPLAAGTSTITASGLRDQLGNTTAQTSTTVDFTPDTDLPTIVRAIAQDATTLRVEFSEPVTEASASAPATYTVDGGVGSPISVTTVPAASGAGVVAAVLTFATPFADRQPSTVTATGLTDLAGNVQPATSATFFSGEGDAAEFRDLVINEFLYDEPTADNPGEFVELFNRTGKSFDLRDFTLNDGTGPDEPITNQAVFVAPGGYAVVVEDGALFQAVFPGVPFVEQPAWSALNNSGDAIVLKYQGTVIDSLQYTPAWGGEDVSVERRDPNGPSVQANFASTLDLRGGTPGEQNSQFAPDVAGPTVLSATASPDGRTVVVTLSEPVDPATLTAGAFTVTGGPTVTAAAYDDAALTVTLTLSAPLAAGTSTITASGLADLLGNVTAASTTTIDFTPDATPPALARAAAPSTTTVRATFTEPVTEASATDAALYSIEGGPSVTSVAVDARDAGGVTAVVLTLGSPLTDQTLYTLAATGLVDLAGNTSGRTETRFFFGTPDTPGPGDVVVNEIMFDPVNGSAGEYVELVNTTADGIFDLRQITLDDGDGDGDALADEPVLLLPGDTLAVVRDGAGFRATFPDAPFYQAGTIISLSNSGEAIVLRAGEAVLDSVFYDPDWHRVELDDATGISLERRDPAGPSNSAANWSSSLAERGGTPSAANTLSVSGALVERDTDLSVTSPFAPTRGESAKITYTLSSEAALVRARIYDGGGRMVRELEPGRLSGQTATLEWNGTGDDRRPMRAGIYVVLIEAVDAQGGTTDAIRGVVVLARPE